MLTTKIGIIFVVANDVMAGTLVLKIVKKENFGRVFSRVMLVDGEALKKCVKMKNHLSRKTDIFVEFDCDVYLRYYAICVKPEYRKKGKKLLVAGKYSVIRTGVLGLGKQLMKSALPLARSFGVPVIMGMFSSRSLQQIALRQLGMRVRL